MVDGGQRWSHPQRQQKHFFHGRSRKKTTKLHRTAFLVAILVLDLGGVLAAIAVVRRDGGVGGAGGAGSPF
jgi:hypothetical protein